MVELVIVATVIVILASVVIPVARFSSRRQREIELKYHLRTMREAIDSYKRYSDSGLVEVKLGTDGYPEELEILVEGVSLIGQIDKKLKLLRRIPVDPMTGEAEWGLRSYQDDHDSTGWGGEDVYDVYSLSTGTALDGSKYFDW